MGAPSGDADEVHLATSETDYGRRRRRRAARPIELRGKVSLLLEVEEAVRRSAARLAIRKSPSSVIAAAAPRRARAAQLFDTPQSTGPAGKERFELTPLRLAVPVAERAARPAQTIAATRGIPRRPAANWSRRSSPMTPPRPDDAAEAIPRARPSRRNPPGKQEHHLSGTCVALSWRTARRRSGRNVLLTAEGHVDTRPCASGGQRAESPSNVGATKCSLLRRQPPPPPRPRD